MNLRARDGAAKTNVAVRIDVELWKRLEELAKAHERSISAEVRVAIRKHLSEPAQEVAA